MNAVLHYNTPIDQYAANYGENRLFSSDEQQTTTQLPKTIALIRVIATIVFTAYLALKLNATIFCLPVLFIGAAFVGWTTYTHLLAKDPLVEVFYRIVGGKDRFDQLPEIRLEQNPNEKISTAIHRLSWNHLNQPMYRTTTLDGRQVVIVKALSRINDGLFFAPTRSILAFIEKVGPDDIPRRISNEPELVESALYAIGAPFAGNRFGHLLYSSDSERVIDGVRVVESYETRICADITSSMANEFFAQLAIR